jgi:hypothetical protein
MLLFPKIQPTKVFVDPRGYPYVIFHGVRCNLVNVPLQEAARMLRNNPQNDNPISHRSARNLYIGCRERIKYETLYTKYSHLIGDLRIQMKTNPSKKRETKLAKYLALRKVLAKHIAKAMEGRELASVSWLLEYPHQI